MLSCVCLYLVRRRPDQFAKNKVGKKFPAFMELIIIDRINTLLLCNMYVKLNYFRVKQFL
jgi:hypothetical protein